MPLASLTIDYATANCDSPALQSAEIEVGSSILRNVSLIAFALSNTPASRLPSVCASLTGSVTCTTNPPATTSLLGYELAGADLTAYYNATTIDLRHLDLSGSLLSDVRVSAIYFDRTRSEASWPAPSHRS